MRGGSKLRRDNEPDSKSAAVLANHKPFPMSLANKILVSGFALLAMMSGWACADRLQAQSGFVLGQRRLEYQIKAAYLYNFARFVEWPDAAFEGPDEPIIVGLLVKDPFGPRLEETIRGKTAHGRPLLVERGASFTKLSERCHVVFISSSFENRLSEVLQDLAGRSILTVSETKEFISRGGMINFVTEHQTVRFVINPTAAEREGLKISSQLMKVALRGKTDR